MHEKTNNNEGNTIENKLFKMALMRDAKAKEERIRYVRENRIENISVVGNVVLKNEREVLEKFVSKVNKNKDSDVHCVKYIQYKYGENGN